MKQSDIDKRVRELTDEAEMLGKQKRTLELLEECAKHGHQVAMTDYAPNDDIIDAPKQVGLVCQRCNMWCTVGFVDEEWENNKWYFPNSVFADFPTYVSIEDIWEGIAPPEPVTVPEGHPPPPPVRTAENVESERAEDGTYRVSWGGLVDKEANE